MAKFAKGQSGNPNGKPKGCRNATTILFDELLKASAKELIEKAIELAKGGDGPALRLCIERLAPARKDRPVWFDFPEMKEAKDAVKASAAIFAAIAAGDLTPSEASELMATPVHCRRRNLRNGYQNWKKRLKHDDEWKICEF